MRRTPRRATGRIRAVALALAAVGATALAAPARADLFSYEATLELDIGSLEPIVVQASGELSVAPDGSFVLPAGVLATTLTVTPPQTPSELVASVQLQLANATGSFAGPASPGGTMGLSGQAVLNLQTAFSFPPLTLGLTPLGAGGTAMATASNGSTALTETITGALWQTGTFFQVGTTVSGSTFGPRTNTGEDLRTAGGEGIVSYVVPAYVSTRVDGGFEERGPLTATLTISFVPEPVRLLAPVALATLLAIHGVRKRR